MDGTNQTSAYPPPIHITASIAVNQIIWVGFSFYCLCNLCPATSFYRVVSPAKSNGIQLFNIWHDVLLLSSMVWLRYSPDKSNGRYQMMFFRIFFAVSSITAALASYIFSSCFRLHHKTFWRFSTDYPRKPQCMPDWQVFPGRFPLFLPGTGSNSAQCPLARRFTRRPPFTTQSFAPHHLFSPCYFPSRIVSLTYQFISRRKPL